MNKSRNGQIPINKMIQDYGESYFRELIETLKPWIPRLKTLFEFYHRQWWTYKQRWSYFKWMYTLLNALALLLVATGMIVGPIIHNSILVAVLAAAGTFVKGWNEFKQYRHKLRMSAFAYTTYAKALNELRQSLRENNTDSLQSFIVKMTSLDDIIVDLAPPIPSRVSEAYKNKYEPCEVDNYKRPPTPTHDVKIFSERRRITSKKATFSG